MFHRATTIFLILLFILFLIVIKKHTKDLPPSFSKTVFIKPTKGIYIKKDEFLLLVNEKDKIASLLNHFGLRLITPLKEWIHVGKKSRDTKKIIALNGSEGKKHQRQLLALKAHPLIHSAHLNYVINPAQSNANDLVPNDPFYTFQWHLSNKHGIHAQNAWKHTKGSKKTTIAVIDSYFEFTSADLKKHQCNNRDIYYENSSNYFSSLQVKKPHQTHGSYVLSILSPCTDNGLGLSGIDWHAKIFAIDTAHNNSYAQILFSLLWAAGIDVCDEPYAGCKNSVVIQNNRHKADIINLSFNFFADMREFPYGPLLDVLGHINNEGSIVVKSAGNEATYSVTTLPLINVSAHNKSMNRALFSNYGPSIDVSAPGKDLIGLDNDEFVLLNGTSFATPLVSGILSLMHSVSPTLPYKRAHYILKKSATPFSCSEYCPKDMKKDALAACQKNCCIGNVAHCSAGKVNAQKAVELAKAGRFKVPLIDLDDYYITLEKENDFKARMIVKNWGQKSGVVRLKKTNTHLKISPAEFIIKKAKSDYQPREIEIELQYDSDENKAQSRELIFEAKSNDDKNFIDTIKAIVEIIPDKDA